MRTYLFFAFLVVALTAYTHAGCRGGNCSVSAAPVCSGPACSTSYSYVPVQQYSYVQPVQTVVQAQPVQVVQAKPVVVQAQPVVQAMAVETAEVPMTLRERLAARRAAIAAAPKTKLVNTAKPVAVVAASPPPVAIVPAICSGPACSTPPIAVAPSCCGQ